MRRAPVAVALVCLGWGSWAVASENVDAARSAILGGVPDSAHPAVVSVLQHIGGDDWQACTGTIIASDAQSTWILTAAHCVVEPDTVNPKASPASAIKIAQGPDYYLKFVVDDYLTAANVVVAPDYSGLNGSPNDIALIRLAGASLGIDPIPFLTAEQDDLGEGDEVTLVGYGDTEEGDNTEKRTVTQSIAWLDAKLIGLDQSNGRGVCHGDSGGPVLIERGGKLTVAGVNSIAKGNDGVACTAASTSVRISRLASFVQSTIAKNGNDSDDDDDGGCSVAAPGPGRGSGPFGVVAMLGVIEFFRRRALAIRAPRRRSAEKRWPGV